MNLTNSLRSGVAWGAFAGMVLLAACASSVHITRDASAPARPAWINVLPQKAGMLYFVGIATDAETLEQGREMAIKDAFAKIANSMAVRVQSRSDDLLTETEQHIRRQISAKSSAMVRGAYETDAYHEKIVRVEKNIRLEKFEVYVLVGIPAAKVGAEVEQQRQDYVRRMAAANDLYLQGQKQMERRSYAEAKLLFGRALKLLDGIEDIITLPGGVKDNRQLVLLLNAEMQKATLRLKRISLSVRADSAFYTHLAAVLSAKGYAIAQDSPAVEVSGEVFLTEDSSVWNRWVCHAQGHLSATRRSDGHVIAILSVRGVGIHQNRRQAVVDALSDAAESAGKELAEKLYKGE